MAVSNTSNREKTLKSMLSVIDNDLYTIDKTLLYCTYNNSGDVVEFGNILDDYRDYFEKYLEDTEVPKHMFYQPAAFAEKYYGTPDLDFIVLYFAKMKSLFDFKQNKIKVLPKHRLHELNKLFIKYKNKVEGSYKNPTNFIREN